MQNYSNLLTAIFILVLLWIWRSLYKRNRIDLLPNIATGLGVFGTFVGIFISLQGFNVNDIQASVPQLLLGMKFAFVTSIAGMLIALSYKYFPNFKYFRLKDDKVQKEGATVDTLATLLSEIKESNDENSELIISTFEEMANKQEGSLKQIEKALIGEGHTTLITQIQKLRTTTIDKFDAQIDAFNTFAEKMAENNSKALIDALTKVMEDFNAKLSQYVGDNFKKLSESIDRMIEWQNLYKEQMDKMAKQIENAMLAIDNSEQVIEKIVDQALKFSETAKDLDNIIVAMYDLKEDLSNELEAFNELANNAKSAFPTIEKSIKDLTNNLSESIQEIIKKNKLMLEEQSKSTKEMFNFANDSLKYQRSKLEESQKYLNSVLESSVANLNNELEKAVKTILQKNSNITDSLLQSLDDQKEKIQRNQELVNQTLHKTIGDVSQRIDRFTNEFSSLAVDRLKKLDESMSEELNESIKKLGSNLASLSNKFVEDYSPLTDKLRDLVEIAERIRGDGR